MHNYWYLRIKQWHYFWGVLIGIALVFIHLLVTLPPLVHYLDGNQYLFTPYTQWISFNTNAWTIALFLGMPLLSALSTSQLIGEDVRTGFYQHILQHKKQSNYLIKSLLISFIGGALTIVIPLLIDFYGMWFFLPSIDPDVILNSNLPLVPATSYFSQLYYTNPNLLVSFYIGLAGLSAGIYAIFSSMIALYTNNKFVSLGSGFVITMIFNVLSSAIPKTVFSPVLISIGLSPVYLPDLWTVLITYCVMLCIFIILGFYGGRKRAYI